MTTAEILTGLRPVTMECFEVFAPYYEERAKHYVYPRYWQSVCYLMWFGNIYYNIIRAKHGKVLVVYKRTYLFHFGLQMLFMPISLTGSMQDELSVILAALKVGISLRVTTEDINRYRIPRKMVEENKGISAITKHKENIVINSSDEFIYQAQRGSAMYGSKYRKLRNLTKRITNASGYSLMTGAHPQIEGVVRDWGDHYLETHQEKASQLDLYHICKSAPPSIRYHQKHCHWRYPAMLLCFGTARS